MKDVRLFTRLPIRTTSKSFFVGGYQLCRKRAYEVQLGAYLMSRHPALFSTRTMGPPQGK